MDDNWEVVGASNSSERKAQVGSTERKFDPMHAGVGGLVRMTHERSQATDAEIQEAFADLGSLMSNAERMVELAERLKTLLDNDETVHDDGGDEVQAMLLSIGLDAPVSKHSGSFHAKVASQLAQFLEKPLERSGGVMPLTDVFCLYNRARGTDLLSPNDVLKAAQHFGAQRSGGTLRLNTLENGVVVVESERHFISEAVLVSLVCEMSSASLAELVQRSGKPLALVQQKLFGAEQTGLLCRDVTAEGVRFFANEFGRFVDDLRQKKQKTLP